MESVLATVNMVEETQERDRNFYHSEIGRVDREYDSATEKQNKVVAEVAQVEAGFEELQYEVSTRTAALIEWVQQYNETLQEIIDNPFGFITDNEAGTASQLDAVQIQGLTFMVSKNEEKMQKLIEENSKLKNYIGSELLNLTTELYYPIIAGNEVQDWPSCYQVGFPGPDNTMSLKIEGGPAEVHYVEILPYYTGRYDEDFKQRINIYVCYENKCDNMCQAVDINKANWDAWNSAMCSLPGEYIILEQDEGYLGLCEIRVYGKPFKYTREFRDDN
ncbi:uncharacterized protein LOC142351935 [Convolutriloba macropyga]|uniref:uncharacterized protein LOC142351935 n=1 Tax=Convolutriloba macropyga TaxID=536237 RepID=UPI003F51EBBD